MRRLLPLLLLLCSLPLQAAETEGYRETLRALDAVRGADPVQAGELQLLPLADGAWVHRSYLEINGVRMHANGVLHVHEQGITVIDTPWTVQASRDLLAFLQREYPGRPLRLIVSHAHDDAIGGIEVFSDAGAAIYANAKTAELARRQGIRAPQWLITESFTLPGGIEVFHPGAAHSADNIVVWLKASRILYAGDVARSRNADSLGNLADADRAAWPASLRAVMQRYPDAEIVVPGHGLHGGQELLVNTLRLLER